MFKTGKGEHLRQLAGIDPPLGLDDGGPVAQVVAQFQHPPHHRQGKILLPANLSSESCSQMKIWH